MLRLILIILGLGSTALLAQVTPEHVENMLGQMVRENVISPEEAQKAKLRLKNISPSQWSEINKQTEIMKGRSPASLAPSENKIEEVKGVDLDGAQFKTIQKEIEKIIPEQKDIR